MIGEHVGIDLRPSHAENGADHAHQAVFDVDELRRLLRALAVDHDQGVLVGGGRSVVVVAAEDGIEEALAGVAGAAPSRALVTEPS